MCTATARGHDHVPVVLNLCAGCGWCYRAVCALRRTDLYGVHQQNRIVSEAVFVNNIIPQVLHDRLCAIHSLQ